MKSRVQAEFLQTDLIEWEDFPEEFQTGGVQWKLLHVSPEIGSWTVLFRCPAGSTFAPHVHHGPAEGYVFEGVIQETTGGGTFTAPGVPLRSCGRRPRRWQGSAWLGLLSGRNADGLATRATR